MGTRNLICVFMNGEYKVAQYGQWDGYPEGQGAGVLNFLHTADMDKFRKQLDFCQWITNEEYEQEWADCGYDGGWVTMEVGNEHGKKYPQNCRDTGSEILGIVYNATAPLKIENSLNFAGDSIFCEWAYVIDLDKNVLEVYKGFNKFPLLPDERFHNVPKQHEEYYPVKLVKSFPLDNLPSENDFVAAFAEEQE